MNKQETQEFAAGMISAVGMSFLFALILLKLMLVPIASRTTFILDIIFIGCGIGFIAVGCLLTLYFRSKISGG